MTIKRDKSSGSSGILDGLKLKKEVVPEENKALTQYNNIKDEIEKAKDLMEEESIRRTFTINSTTYTMLNELKVYILPAVTGQKKWGYNTIVNIAIQEYYARAKESFEEKLKK